MSFKTDLREKINQAKVSDLENQIRHCSSAGFRSYQFILEFDYDVSCHWFFRLKLLPTGQAIWDKLVELGFQPKLGWYNDWCFSGQPVISIKW